MEVQTEVQTEVKLVKTQISQAVLSVTHAKPIALPSVAILLLPACFIGVWVTVFLTFFGVPKTRLTQNSSSRPTFPCQNCRFFYPNAYLPCAVRPTVALTQAAIDCPDYQKQD